MRGLKLILLSEVNLGASTKKIWEGDKETHTQVDIATTRQKRPKGRFSEKDFFLNKALWPN